MKNKKIVLTDDIGFIGLNLIRTLSKNNHVTIIDDLSTGRLVNVKDLIDDNILTINCSYI